YRARQCSRAERLWWRADDHQLELPWCLTSQCWTWTISIGQNLKLHRAAHLAFLCCYVADYRLTCQSHVKSLRHGIYAQERWDRSISDWLLSQVGTLVRN